MSLSLVRENLWLIEVLDNSEVEQQFNDYNQHSQNQEHHAKLSHEIIGGAAAYEAAKAYEDHVAKNGEIKLHNTTTRWY